MRRRQGLTLIGMSIVIVLLGLLGILLSQSTASSLTVGAQWLEPVQTRLANTIAVLRGLRGAGNLRRGLANPSPALPSGDVLWYQVPVGAPPGSGVVLQPSTTGSCCGRHQDTLGGWTGLRFEATATINEAALGLAAPTPTATAPATTWGSASGGLP